MKKHRCGELTIFIDNTGAMKVYSKSSELVKCNAIDGHQTECNFDLVISENEFYQKSKELVR